MLQVTVKERIYIPLDNQRLDRRRQRGKPMVTQNHEITGRKPAIIKIEKRSREGVKRERL